MLTVVLFFYYSHLCVSHTPISHLLAVLTVSVVVPLMVPDIAVMVVVPVVWPVASPLALIVAVEVADELHITAAVRFMVVPSLNIPRAVNCCVNPAATDGFAGVTAIDCSVAALTVSVVEPLMVPDTAVMVVVPIAIPVASPLALIAAVDVALELHVAVAVRFEVLPSLNVPVAVNCCVSPAATDGLTGVTAIDCSMAAVTVSVVVPLMAPDVAVTVVVPTATPVARPLVLIVAVEVADELHVAVPVRFMVVPSLNVPVAVNCCLSPAVMEGLAGVTAIDCSVSGGIGVASSSVIVAV